MDKSIEKLPDNKKVTDDQYRRRIKAREKWLNGWKLVLTRHKETCEMDLEHDKKRMEHDKLHIKNAERSIKEIHEELKELRALRKDIPRLKWNI